MEYKLVVQRKRAVLMNTLAYSLGLSMSLAFYSDGVIPVSISSHARQNWAILILPSALGTSPSSLSGLQKNGRALQRIRARARTQDWSFSEQFSKFSQMKRRVLCVFFGKSDFGGGGMPPCPLYTDWYLTCNQYGEDCNSIFLCLPSSKMEMWRVGSRIPTITLTRRQTCHDLAMTSSSAVSRSSKSVHRRWPSGSICNTLPDIPVCFTLFKLKC